ncbi:MAG: hypothetical protein HY719_17090 [Planctomycetes bacterium]|nr:hypothetical protein [Planctomycetota bacterium]
MFCIITIDLPRLTVPFGFCLRTANGQIGDSMSDVVEPSNAGDTPPASPAAVGGAAPSTGKVAPAPGPNPVPPTPAHEVKPPPLPPVVVRRFNGMSAGIGFLCLILGAWFTFFYVPEHSQESAQRRQSLRQERLREAMLQGQGILDKALNATTTLLTDEGPDEWALTPKGEWWLRVIGWVLLAGGIGMVIEACYGTLMVVSPDGTIRPVVKPWIVFGVEVSPRTRRIVVWSALLLTVASIVPLTFVFTVAVLDAKRANVSSTEEFPAQTTRVSPAVIGTGTENIAEDTYWFLKFAIFGKTDVRVTGKVLSGPPIDLYTMPESGFSQWRSAVSEGRKKGTWTFLTQRSLDCEGMGYTGFRSVFVPQEAGTYYLVLDNTNYGATQPPTNMKTDVSVVEWKVESK